MWEPEKSNDATKLESNFHKFGMFSPLWEITSYCLFYQAKVVDIRLMLNKQRNQAPSGEKSSIKILRPYLPDRPQVRVEQYCLSLFNKSIDSIVFSTV